MAPTAPESEDEALTRWRDSAMRAAGRAYETAHGREIDDESRGIRWALSPRVALTAAGVIGLIALLVWALARPAASEPLAADEQPSPLTSAAPAPSVSAAAAVAVVHVAGAVVTPGLVELSPGERVADAIERAGGSLEDADLSALNLARVPLDGEQIAVPRVGEAGTEADSTVRLNSADAAALEALPGVGPVTAANIVADREANGPYASLDDLERVPGIGPALVSRLDGLVTM